ncbi:unnamed protein product [Owenia fusiformis]|uniref:Uncharacterized protein n=1 Tax=Owenia fusiformis TaxID=6347 RepID=A0A8J1U5M8_OWEFU|nr:unnamed protein product [Owenia fusiformis]
MENDILDSLEDLGYTGPLIDENTLYSAVDAGAPTPEFTHLVAWLSTDLCGFCKIEENVGAITSSDDCGNFLLELSGFLRELGCPYPALSDGPINQRLESKENKLQLLDYLCTELQAMRVVATSKPEMFTSAMQVEVQAESDMANYMKNMLMALGFPKPPASITSFQLFSKIEAKIKELLNKLPADHLGKPLLKVRLSDKQWATLEEINSALLKEYETRRSMILKRLDVTIQSFKWSDKAKHKEDLVASKYQPIRKLLTSKSSVQVGALLSARDDLLKIEKTSNAEIRERTKCEINKVLIGRVPDRGGRTLEMEAPPPEMPSFMKRSDAPRGGGRGGRGGGRGGEGGGYRGGGRGDQQGGGGRGGRVQGGWGGDRPQSGGGGWGGGGNDQQQQGGGAGLAFFGGGGGGGGGGGYPGGGGGGGPRGGGGRGRGGGRGGRGGRGRQY